MKSLWSRVVKWLIPSLVTAVILMGVFCLIGITPFGNKTILWADASVQYVDFFAYFKDLIAGKATIGYSFSNQLGGNMFANFSYYLLSPFNVLMIFFEKSQIPLFFTIITILKLSLAALTCYMFLRERFCKESKHYWLAVLLSVTYAISGYSMQQMSNTMWIDGVYMLPLVLLGVSNMIYHKKSALFIGSTALSIIFNWYTGAINLLFATVWFMFESSLYISNNKLSAANSCKFLLNKMARAALSTVLALMLSAVVLLPTVAALSSGGRGTIDFSMLLNNDFRGSILSSIQAYLPGAESTNYVLAIFIGSIPLLVFINAFFIEI